MNDGVNTLPNFHNLPREDTERDHQSQDEYQCCYFDSAIKERLLNFCHFFMVEKFCSMS